MLNHLVRKMLGGVLLSVPFLLSGGINTAQAQDSDAVFDLYNDTDRAIIYFYVSPSESNDWGPDILLDGVIMPGESATVIIPEGLNTCYYDFMATLGEGEGVGSGDLYQTNINVCDLEEYRYGY